MASGGISQWDGSDRTEIASHIRQVESYFVVKEIEDEQKKVAVLHLSVLHLYIKLSQKHFSRNCQQLKPTHLLTQKLPARSV